MKLLKIRRVGNSNVVSIPREFTRFGFDAETDVLIQEVQGTLVLTPLTEAKRRELILEATSRAMEAHQLDMKKLEEHDRAPAYA